MFMNSSGDKIDAFIVFARPTPVTNESVKNMLNGSWHIQSIGTPAETMSVELVCGWDVVQELQEYAETKELLTVEYLDFEKVGFILNAPAYTIQMPRPCNPIYLVDFELAVIPDV